MELSEGEEKENLDNYDNINDTKSKEEFQEIKNNGIEIPLNPPLKSIKINKKNKHGERYQIYPTSIFLRSVL